MAVAALLLIGVAFAVTFGGIPGALAAEREPWSWSLGLGATSTIGSRTTMAWESMPVMNAWESSHGELLAEARGHLPGLVVALAGLGDLGLDWRLRAGSESLIVDELHSTRTTVCGDVGAALAWRLVSLGSAWDRGVFLRGGGEFLYLKAGYSDGPTSAALVGVRVVAGGAAGLRGEVSYDFLPWTWQRLPPVLGAQGYQTSRQEQRVRGEITWRGIGAAIEYNLVATELLRAGSEVRTNQGAVESAGLWLVYRPAGWVVE